jgi:hypothetical protein
MVETIGWFKKLTLMHALLSMVTNGTSVEEEDLSWL